MMHTAHIRYTGGVIFACLGIVVVTATFGTNSRAGDNTRSELERSFREQIHPLLQTYCFACHGKDKPKGDMDLRTFDTVDAVLKDFTRWEAVLDQIKSEEMPPKSAKKQPSKDERRKILAWTDTLRKSEAERNAGDPGIVLARRLTNAEYDCTIRELTGQDLRPTREFPIDPANDAGFDNTGETLVMSPALVNKYLAAGRHIADHLLLTPLGLAFAPFPVITDTDRDKYCVRRIIDFYKRQPTDYADYFHAAWRFKHRAALGIDRASLADCAAVAKVSPKYFEMVWKTLTTAAPDVGPIAAVQSLWNALPSPTENRPDEVLRQCRRMRDFVNEVRGKVKVSVGNLTVRGMNRGAQALVLWKDRQMATNRRTYGGNASQIKVEELTHTTAVARFLAIPKDDAARKSMDAEYKRFCAVFPDAFYVSERARVFLDGKEDKENTGRLLSAGFHNQMGYFRDDQPLAELILDDAGRRTLDGLWHEFDFVSNVPMRMHSGLIWFERSESLFLAGEEFDFARSEDKDVGSESKFKRFADNYIRKTRNSTTNDTVVAAVKEHFERSEANIRRVEKARLAAEPVHLAALADFASRAYRRKLGPRERDAIAQFYRSIRTDDGVSHEDAIRDTLVSILMSPHFCYRVDLPTAAAKSGATTLQPLSTDALASRLSYFLWSSMPDQELLDSAAAGTLSKPDVLLAQTRRMLNDERVRGLATQFGGNWLDFKRFHEHNAVDRGQFPSFDNDLRDAMHEEPIRFLMDVVRNDRSVLDLLHANHTFVNPVLARHYGMPMQSTSAQEWTRIDHADKFGRGGILPMAVFMTKNAPGLRTSPVKRGYWVVRNVLGERIPPPPPNVPELPSDEKKLGDATLREVLARHREDKNCATCHARFDSFGIAFEGFGPIGERRTKDLAGRAVDTHVAFPDGGEGTGLQGLRDHLRTQRQNDFVDNLCRKLLAYGLERRVQLSDDPTIAQMHTVLKSQDYRFSSLIETIVASKQFRNRRATVAPEKE